MEYPGRVSDGVVIFDGARPPDGALVRVEEIPPTPSPTWGEVLADLIGTVDGPADLATNHDHYAHGKPRND